MNRSVRPLEPITHRPKERAHQAPVLTRLIAAMKFQAGDVDAIDNVKLELSVTPTSYNV